jgi:nucleotide-binding universal stress UspA family protein
LKLDDFESVFRSAVKARFRYQPPVLESALLVTDLDPAQSEAILKSVQSFLESGHGAVEWSTMNGGDFSEVADVLDRVRRNPPSLVVTYRHVLGQGAALPYSLGSTVDTLTQATDVPVLLLPRPVKGELEMPRTTGRVMVVTDHLTGDDRLVNWASYLCTDDGTLFLTHIEDEEVLAKYVDVCSKIPGIDQALVEEKIPKKLLDMPRDYVHSIAEVLASHENHETIESIVRLGDPVKDYEALVKEHDIDLLVMNTKDAGQSAMHALAYALAVEIRTRPLLLL